MLVLIWASLISLFESSTPMTSSPCTDDRPIFVFTKSISLVIGLGFFLSGDFGSFIPFKDGFLNFKFLSFPKIFETLFFSCAPVSSSMF